MASLPIYNKTRRGGRQVRHRSDATCAADQQAIAARRGGDVPGQPAAGHAPHQEPRRSGRHDQEDVSPEGHGQRPAGSRRSGIRRGGGHIFAMQPRDYQLSPAAKAVQSATRMALASKIADEDIVVIDELAFSQPKTKEMAGILKALKLDGTSHAGGHGRARRNVYKSARNIDQVTVSPVAELNALAVLQPRKMLVTQGGAGCDQGAGREEAGQKPQAKSHCEAGTATNGRSSRSRSRTSTNRPSSRVLEAAPGDPASAGDRKGHAPLDAVQPVCVRGQSCRRRRTTCGGRSKSCST